MMSVSLCIHCWCGRFCCWWHGSQSVNLHPLVMLFHNYQRSPFCILLCLYAPLLYRHGGLRKHHVTYYALDMRIHNAVVTASVMAVIVIGYFSLLIYYDCNVYDKPKFRLVARSSVTWRWYSSVLCGLYLRLESGPFHLVMLCDAGHELRKAGSDSVSFQSCPSMRYFGNILHINSM